MTRFRRLALVIAGLAVASLALNGCLYAAIPAGTARPQASSTDAPPDTDGVADDLLPYYSQTLSWTDCGDGLDCTTLKAPLDWENPSGDSIELAVTRHHAGNGAPIGSLLMNPGGPGASAYDYVHDYYPYLFTSAQIENWDLIGFDPRGVGHSSAVRCYDDADLDAYLFDLPTAPRGSDAWRAEILDGAKRFADACEANSDGILPYLTTTQSARDMDLVRAVLGQKQLDYIGYSYGTLLGATYAGLYPDKVGRMELNGAIDPSLVPWEDSAQQLGGFQSAMRNYLADCVQSSDCPFRGTVDQALADLSTLLASVDASPLTASDGRRFNADSLISTIQSALYSQSSWPTLTQALSDVLQGSPDTAFTLIDSYFDRDGGKYVSNLWVAFLAYQCLDPGPLSDADRALYEAKIAEVAPTFAPYYIGSPDTCSVWPYSDPTTPAPITAEGAAPIVVVGTTGDPATPYEAAVSLADQLSSGVLVTYQGEGHTVSPGESSCIDDALDAYFDDGIVPQDGLTCQ